MKCLYQIFVLKNTNLEYDTSEIIHEQLEVENEFVSTMISGILEHLEDIKIMANQYLVDWKIERLNLVDQSIICIGIYELKYTDTPSIVAINEAIELSKRYSDEAVTKMINGVLDNIYHSEENNG